ncbi:hypothetical protein DFQ01_11495 [Paenibacillus cellulosilyticus]|uniref:Alpha/beta superfamily hydrolase n=1 Tax=Paenibacillus cellulosilyticus TaxID=375489 RepID=A0A2V2YR09_9BACL|nr:alpha/beta hydrolase-fold protein [Paenibacillus cellulosilyticus]PWV99517.1 hypothetical protein DFQ01_11495 [Paenibacillus cellulosilyticus]QKS44770.1 alpha/beta hydrolase [Paenibacillus cellulosilyticus]
MSKWTEVPYLMDRYTEFEVTSDRGLDYRIMAATPSVEAPAEGYGVVFALDGDALFLTLAETVRLQTRKPKGYDPILVIGIGYPSREPFDVDRRCRDFTMNVGGAALPVRPDGRAWPPNGEADHFLDFIENELMSVIAERWPINRDRQAIVGHSLGGLLVLHTLFTRSHLFSHYIAGSSSVWWADNKVLQELESFRASWQQNRNVRLLLAIGANELPDMLEGTALVAQGMEPLLDKGIALERFTFADTEHVSVIPSTLGQIPRFIWS